jgi:hypothetical protein
MLHLFILSARAYVLALSGARRARYAPRQESLRGGSLMATLPRTKEQIAETIRQVTAEGGNVSEAARKCGIPRATMQSRYREAITLLPVEAPIDLVHRVSDLQAKLKAASQVQLSEDLIRNKIIGIAKAPLDVPKWSLGPPSRGRTIGIPMTIWSDWHFGEVVFPSQVNGVNEFDLAIAHQRVRVLIDRTIDLLLHHMVNPNYPGIIVCLGGDLVSGGIHDELAQTDAAPIMPIVIDVYGVLIWALGKLAEKFGRVWMVGISGNHGRNTKKIWAKHRNYTNFDWLVSQMLAKHFEADKRFSFYIPDGPDAHVKVFDYSYLFTHGDRLGRGGDGMIGSVGPIHRGTLRKQARDSQIAQPFDTLVHGHFHTLSQTQRIIGNGSLIGYNEYAYTEGFMFEIPQQAIWIHHPERGITWQTGVHLVDKKAATKGVFGAESVVYGRI